MDIWLDKNYEILILVALFGGFVWLAQKRFKMAVYLIIFLAPAYLLRVKIFFVPTNVQEILIWLMFLVWLARREYRNVICQQAKKFLWPVLAILAGVAVSTVFSQNLRMSAGIFKGWFLAPMIFGLVALTQLETEEEIKKALWALVASGMAVSAISFFYWFGGKATFDGRLSGIFLSPNHLAMYLAPCFLSALGVFWLSTGKKEKFFIIAAILLIVLAIYLTFSYAAWMAVLLAVLFALAIKIKFSSKKIKLFTVYCFLFTVLLGTIFVSQLGSAKLNNLLHSSRSSWQSRQMVWQAAFLIGKNNPIFGIGPGMFQEYYLQYQKYFTAPYLEWAVPQPHNLFLAFWLETGILGLAGFIWLVALFAVRIYGLVKKKNGIALVLAMIIVYIIAHGLVDTPYFKNDLAAVFWLIISFGVSLSCGPVGARLRAALPYSAKL